MCTSDKIIKSKLHKILTGLILSSACAVFGGIYEHFSHGVYSNYMIYAFLIPLFLSVIPGIVILLNEKSVPTKTTSALWNAGVATLTIGCIFQGVLEIYGTTNRLMIVYPSIAAGLMAAGITVWIIDLLSRLYLN